MLKLIGLLSLKRIDNFSQTKLIALNFLFQKSIASGSTNPFLKNISEYICIDLASATSKPPAGIFKNLNILNQRFGSCKIFNKIKLIRVEKKKINSVYMAILQKQEGEIVNRDLLCALNLLIKQPILSVKSSNNLEDNKSIPVAIKNSFYTKLKSIYYLYYFFLKKNN